MPPASLPRSPLVLSAVRTPVGRHAGSLSGTRPDDLLAGILREAVDRAAVDPERLDEVSVGIVNASGEAMGNVARYAALLAGLPASVAGVSMNRFCGSGLAALNALAHGIAAGGYDAGVAAGVETMSRSTWPVLKPQGAKYVGPIAARDSMFSGAGGPQHPALEADGTMIEMPQAAQLIADELGISRAAMDAFAERSHHRAAAAAAAGRFDDEIAPVRVGEDWFAADETIRADTSLERLAALRPYDPLAPQITAGNASPVSDGASALVLAADDLDLPAGTRPLARVVGTAVAALPPARFSLAPIEAIKKLLARTGVDLDEVELVEINEAFAAQMVACIRGLDLDESRVNVNGGAIALGHALGNSGTRLTVTLLHEMRRRGARYGIASLCIAAGQGIATLFERVEEEG
ncbi:MAG: thiolase family protein [Actinobacteria bacterium]|nr:thiolase family protein [Actinomycetota bacterium]